MHACMYMHTWYQLASILRPVNRGVLHFVDGKTLVPLITGPSVFDMHTQTGSSIASRRSAADAQGPTPAAFAPFVILPCGGCSEGPCCRELSSSGAMCEISI